VFVKKLFISISILLLPDILAKVDSKYTAKNVITSVVEMLAKKCLVTAPVS